MSEIVEFAVLTRGPLTDLLQLERLLKEAGLDARIMKPPPALASP